MYTFGLPKEGQEDQGEVKELGRTPGPLVLLAFLLALPWPLCKSIKPGLLLR